MAELVEDVQGILPGCAGGGWVAGGVAGVAEVAENNGLPVTLAEGVVKGRVAKVCRVFCLAGWGL